MKATEAKLRKFLKNSPPFIIPIYRRTYSWLEKECEQLRENLLQTRRNLAVCAHLVGSMVYLEKALFRLQSVRRRTSWTSCRRQSDCGCR